MKQYTILCTHEQWKKALELGAPIEIKIETTGKPNVGFGYKRNIYTIPTAEQMLGWLEEQGVIIDISFRGTDEPDKKGNKIYIYHLFDFKKWEELNPLSDIFPSRGEATLAAIDAALDYLLNTKKDTNEEEPDKLVQEHKGKAINANGHSFVDLGLPSGRLWATCNVGASKPEEYGDYFAWGETEPKEVYNWSTYKHGDKLNGLFKYTRTDGKTVLDPEDDAVCANMGGDWKMPTKQDFEELIEGTTSEWTTVNGVNGRLFTSKINGGTMFIPASGYRFDSLVGSQGGSASLRGSSLDIDYPNYIWGLYLYLGGVRVSDDNRSYGFCVRGVL